MLRDRCIHFLFSDHYRQGKLRLLIRHCASDAVVAPADSNFVEFVA